MSRSRWMPFLAVVGLWMLVSLACNLPTTPVAPTASPVASQGGGAAPTSLPPRPTNAPPPVQDKIPFRAVVQITALVDDNGDLIEGWTGSGTIITPDGLILTNAHVVLSDKYFRVEKLLVSLTETEDTPPVPTYYAEVMQADPDLDIAVIRVSTDLDGNPVDRAALRLPFARLGDPSRLRLGDPLTILGYPGIGGQTITLTRGEVSGFTAQEPYGNRAFIKTSATIAGGNSGGLAANARGELIGVPTQLGYGGEDQFVDCRTLADTNRDGVIDENDACVPTGGFINALRPVDLALPLIEAAKRGEVSVVEAPAQPSVEPGTFPTAGEQIYSEDFARPTADWPDDTLTGGALWWQDGRYHIRVDETQHLIWNTPGLDLGGATLIEADAQVVAPTGEGDFGIICRYQDSDNFYALEVSEDGYAAIWMYLNGDYQSLVDWTPLPAGVSLSDGVRLRAACVRDRLVLAAGDTVLVEASDRSLHGGDVGLIVGTWDTGGLEVAFDNVAVFQVGGTAGPTQPPTNPTPPTGGQTLFSDDFSNPDSGWATGQASSGQGFYRDGRFHLQVDSDSAWLWSTADWEGADVMIVVDAFVERPTGEGDFGIICRYQDGENFYALEISEDGYYAIWKMENGQESYLVDWTPSPDVPQEGPIVLGAACAGDQLVLAVQDHILAQVQDSTFTSGKVGLIAGTFNTGGLWVSFDNFEVSAP